MTFTALAHPGGLDAQGCHSCRTNCEKYGLQDNERHCRTGNSTSPKPEAKQQAEPKTEQSEGIVQIDYSGGFTVWLDCDHRGPLMTRFNAQRDVGNEKRKSSFKLDPDISKNCQQYSGKTYKAPTGATSKYDRGHIVPANLLDHTAVGIAQTNFMTNIVPMASKVNRHGAWRYTEILTDCYRDIDELQIYAGVVWGDDESDDHFIKSHGIVTPDHLWKLIVRGDGRTNAWIIPNSDEATDERIDEYAVPVLELERIT
ncbi:MAG: DNA/RNA non-specific endonuclease, partial [Gammaproteobacteria bacterium]|nr:DNA/RNA non-specific endonuclease [Gammaproteobacteria bacterium]